MVSSCIDPTLEYGCNYITLSIKMSQTAKVGQSLIKYVLFIGKHPEVMVKS